MSKTTLKCLDQLCSSMNGDLFANAPYGIGVERIKDKIAVIRRSRKVAADRQPIFRGSAREVDAFLTGLRTQWLFFREV